MEKFHMRMGDGSATELSESELRRDLEDGTKDAAERAKIPPLSQNELAYLFDVYSNCFNSLLVCRTRYFFRRL